MWYLIVVNFLLNADFFKVLKKFYSKNIELFTIVQRASFGGKWKQQLHENGMRWNRDTVAFLSISLSLSLSFSLSSFSLSLSLALCKWALFVCIANQSFWMIDRNVWYTFTSCHMPHIPHNSPRTSHTKSIDRQGPNCNKKD